MIYFTSDNHFGHDNIVKWTARKWKTVEEMDEGLIKRWNGTVKESDTVIVVGDFAFSNSTRRTEILSRLNGTKILVRGNHDKVGVNPLGFDLVVDELTMNIAKQPVTIKHYPLKSGFFLGLSYKFRATRFVKRWVPTLYKRLPRYLDRMPLNKGQYHIHGHTHSTEKFRENQIHVGCEAWDCTPVSLTKISAYIQSRESKRRSKIK